jgi:hypothetical protein
MEGMFTQKLRFAPKSELKFRDLLMKAVIPSAYVGLVLVPP